MWCKWDNSINRNVAEIRYGDVCWFHLAQNRILWQIVVNTVMNLWVPREAGNFETSFAFVSFS